MSIRHTKYHKPPVYEGEIFVEKSPPDGYVGKHVFNQDHDRIGHNGVIWMGCKMCRESIGLSDPLPTMTGRDRYWNEVKV